MQGDGGDSRVKSPSPPSPPRLRLVLILIIPIPLLPHTSRRPGRIPRPISPHPIELASPVQTQPALDPTTAEKRYRARAPVAEAHFALAVLSAAPTAGKRLLRGRVRAFGEVDDAGEHAELVGGPHARGVEGQDQGEIIGPVGPFAFDGGAFDVVVAVQEAEFWEVLGCCCGGLLFELGFFFQAWFRFCGGGTGSDGGSLANWEGAGAPPGGVLGRWSWGGISGAAAGSLADGEAGSASPSGLLGPRCNRGGISEVGWSLADRKASSASPSGLLGPRCNWGGIREVDWSLGDGKASSASPSGLYRPIFSTRTRLALVLLRACFPIRALHPLGWRRLPRRLPIRRDLALRSEIDVDANVIGCIWLLALLPGYSSWCCR